MSRCVRRVVLGVAVVFYISGSAGADIPSSGATGLPATSLNERAAASGAPQDVLRMLAMAETGSPSNQTTRPEGDDPLASWIGSYTFDEIYPHLIDKDMSYVLSHSVDVIGGRYGAYTLAGHMAYGVALCRVSVDDGRLELRFMRVVDGVYSAEPGELLLTLRRGADGSILTDWGAASPNLQEYAGVGKRCFELSHAKPFGDPPYSPAENDLLARVHLQRVAAELERTGWTVVTPAKRPNFKRAIAPLEHDEPDYWCAVGDFDGDRALDYAYMAVNSEGKVFIRADHATGRTYLVTDLPDMAYRPGVGLVRSSGHDVGSALGSGAYEDSRQQIWMGLLGTDDVWIHDFVGGVYRKRHAWDEDFDEVVEEMAATESGAVPDPGSFASESESAALVPDVREDAGELCRLFKENRFAFDEKYMNKVVALSGEVGSVSDTSPGASVNLRGSDVLFGSLPVPCQLRETEVRKAMLLNPGDNVTVIGHCSGDALVSLGLLGSVPELTGCVIEKMPPGDLSARLQPLDPGVEVRLDRIAEELQENEVRAMAKYAGKRVRIRGKWDSVNRDYEGHARLSVMDFDAVATCTLKSGQERAAAAIDLDRPLLVEASFSERLMGELYFVDGVILE